MTHILVTFATIAVAITLFSVPLILKYQVYVPETKRLIVGDMVKVEGHLSCIWCEGVYLDSKTEFRSFKYDSEPEVDESYVERTYSKHHTVLPNNDQEYWGFQLLRGSAVNISACARLLTAYVSVVKGRSGLNQCLKEHRIKHLFNDVSGEDSPSESESDEDTSSISSSQGVIMNDTDRPYICSNALQHVELSTSYTCKYPFKDVVLKSALYQEIEETDQYFYIFSSNSYLDILPNDFSFEFTIDRTFYNYNSSTGNCSNNKHCEFDIDIRKEPVLVVQMTSSNGTLRTNDLIVACKHRKSFFLLFYGMFMMVIFFCAFQ